MNINFELYHYAHSWLKGQCNNSAFTRLSLNREVGCYNYEISWLIDDVRTEHPPDLYRIEKLGVIVLHIAN